jgi:hypothetical protein
MKFYSIHATYTIPLPTIQQVININGQNVIQSISPGTIKFERGAYDTKTLKHLMPEDKQAEFIKRTSAFGVEIFETPEPVKIAAKAKSTIIGTHTTAQPLVNKDKLPINQQQPEQSGPEELGTTVKMDFKSKNDLVKFLINEKGVKSEDLKGKKGPEIVKYAKEVHKIDVSLVRE